MRISQGGITMPSIEVPQLRDDYQVFTADDLLRLQESDQVVDGSLPDSTEGPCCLCTYTCVLLTMHPEAER